MGHYDRWCKRAQTVLLVWTDAPGALPTILLVQGFFEKNLVTAWLRIGGIFNLANPFQISFILKPNQN
jgi:hypothetical protein